MNKLHNNSTDEPYEQCWMQQARNKEITKNYSISIEVKIRKTIQFFMNV